MKLELVSAFMALNILSAAQAQTAPVAPVDKISEEAKNARIADVASSCEAILAVSAVNLPKIFTAKVVDPAMIKFADIGQKAVGFNKYTDLTTKKTTDTSFALGFIKHADPIEHGKAVQANADGANRCLGLYKSGWPNPNVSLK